VVTSARNAEPHGFIVTASDRSLDESPPRGFRIVINAVIGLLGLEFLLGTAVALYVHAFPQDLLGVFGSVAGASLLLYAHGATGLAVALVALLEVGWSFRLPARSLFYGSLAGLLGIVLAGASGYEFLASSAAPQYAFLMGLGFLAAFWAFFWVRNVVSARWGLEAPPRPQEPPVAVP
jgi:hypothetical protein